MTKSILIVDDEQEILDVIGEMLGSLGYSSQGVKQGTEALRLIKKRKFDLVITDLIMPEMGGLIFIKKLRRQAKDIPIIITAGVDLKDSCVDLNKYGINDFIRKPFFIDDVDKKLKKLLEESKLALIAEK
jgi:DNA-binding NtrC family response regulator